jgi:hypothetical protein
MRADLLLEWARAYSSANSNPNPAEIPAVVSAEG